MEYYELIKERFSCKKYSERKIEDSLLLKILEAGNLAPTAKNQQSQRIFVISSEEGLKKIDGAGPCRYNAPVVLLFCYNRNEVYIYPDDDRNTGIEDASIVATHIMLAAANEGINSCWVNNFSVRSIKESFELDADTEPVLLMDLGYAADGAGPLANHEKKKELNETVRFI